MPLDPIVSLSVALAEAPGSVALFLGSGVSVDAGIPTGWQIYIDGVQRLRRLEAGDVEPLDSDEAIDDWLAETGRANFTYARLLEDLTPDAATRREYIAGFFDQAAVGDTHRAIANLVATGLVRVIVTTNFDRMLEQALNAVGIEPVVVSDDATLRASVRREHASCFVLKAHGDYLQETIRNTPGELAELEPEITSELQAIFDRYGVLLVGYSGNDPAIADALKRRDSRYGLWWMSVSDPPRDPIPGLLERTGGRLIHRASASSFFADLDSRLAVYAAHPTGHTPASVHDEVLQLLRRDDHVGLAETLRREHNAFEQALIDWTDTNSSKGTSFDEVEIALGPLLDIAQRRLAALLPVVTNSSDRTAGEARSLARAVEARSRGGLWQDPARYAAWVVGYVSGAVATRLEKWEGAIRIAATEIEDGREPEFLLRRSGSFGEAVAQLHRNRDDKQYFAGEWEHLHTAVRGWTWLCDRYPEIYRGGEGDDSVRAHLSAFDFVVNCAAVVSQERHVAYWSMSSQAAETAARQMHRSTDALPALASLAGEPLDGLEQIFGERLDSYTRFLGDFPDPQRAVDLLLRGRTDRW